MPPCGPAPVSPASRRSVRWAGLVLVLVVGLTARLTPWASTFTADGVRFRNDSDPYYHALRAQRIVEDWPRVPWTDPRLNFPDGAAIPWPPLFDTLIAAAAKLGDPHGADRERVARAAALVPLPIGIALLPITAYLGRALLGGGLWLDAALLVALLPAMLRFGAVGCADQHGMEILLFCCLCLAFVRSWKGERGTKWCAPASLGLVIALAFWNWLGSALGPLVLVAFAASWFVLAPAGDAAAPRMARALLLGGSIATVLLAVSIFVLGPEGALAQASLGGLTALHVAMCAMVAAFGGVLLAADRLRPPPGHLRRLIEVVAVALAVGAPVLAVPTLREGVQQGLRALITGDPWYQSIAEYRPFLPSRMKPLSADLALVVDYFGFGPIAMLFGVGPLLCRWRRSPEERPSILFVLLWGAAFLALTIRQARFGPYLVVPMALWICLALRCIADLAGRRLPGRAAVLRPAVLGAGVLLVAGPTLSMAWSGHYAAQRPVVESDLIPILRWLRDVPPVSVDRPGVMAPWAAGHHVQYWADKPVVASPFGTEGGRGAMQDWTAFLYAPDAGTAETLLSRRRIGFVLAYNPMHELTENFGLAPAGAKEVARSSYDWRLGQVAEIDDAYFDLVVSRLYYFDGMTSGRQGESLGGFRLLAESPRLERIPEIPRAHLYKVFGCVPGALVAATGVLPHGELRAASRLATNQQRIFVWETRTVADAEGRASLRLPYATGLNGRVEAAPYVITDGARSTTLVVGEDAVSAGASIAVDLGG